MIIWKDVIEIYWNAVLREDEARFGPTHLCNEALKLLQEASATMGECRCIMDYVISHNADGVREFRRVSEAEPRLEAEVFIFWESENRFDFSCRLWSCWNDPKSLLSTRSNLCVDSNFVLTGCGNLEDWCTCGSFWNQKVVIEHPRCSFVTMGSRAGRVLGRVSEAKPGKRKSFSLKHWDDFEVLLKQFSLCSSFFWYSPLFFPSFVSMTHVINQWVSTIRIYLFGTSYVPSRNDEHTQTRKCTRRLPEDLPQEVISEQPGAAQVVDLSDEDCCVLDSQWHDFYLSSHDWLPVAAKLIFSTIQHWWNWRLEIMVYIASGLKCSWVWSVSKILDIQKGGAVPEVLQPVAEKADKRWHEHTSAMPGVMQRFSWAHFLNLNDSLDGSLPRRGSDWDLSGAGSSGWVQDIVSRLHSS